MNPIPAGPVPPLFSGEDLQRRQRIAAVPVYVAARCFPAYGEKYGLLALRRNRLATGKATEQAILRNNHP